MIFARMIYFVLGLLEILILIEVVLSWIMIGNENKYTMMIHRMTEPFLEPGRRIQESLFPNLMIDFSPFVAIVIITFLKRLLIW
ncbi:YGGT family protein [Clostridium tepidiprofundi DSM 19306]|uniref:YGGT family protein n=1 Tax=Clostridium tepidiprofundi DSM 19306 TaxID=1121338 RepID=A0A151B7E8_9CLOT|nr:YggT family protein [Clostridium tepidiprofundi]KYH35662.1 YGGT family protein [Clostridium tepidiprofundi DSM 19306]